MCAALFGHKNHRCGPTTILTELIQPLMIFFWFLRMVFLLWWHHLQDAHDIQEQLMTIYT